MMKREYLCLFICLLAACHGKQKSGEKSADELFQQQDSVLMQSTTCSDTIRIQYAQGLKVRYLPDGIHISISNPDPSGSHTRTEEIVLTHPANRFVCTTALQLGNFEVLGLEDKVVAINSLKHLFSPKVRKQLETQQTIKIGMEGNFDLERVIATQPDYIFVSASKHGGFQTLKDCGIPLIHHHGYKETTPLGQAEWIKLIGLLAGEPRRANAVFADIERKYLRLKNEVDSLCHHSTTPLPTVASGRQLREGWYMVGGKSYMAQIFHDAGARYLLADNDDSGGVTWDFEAAYARSIHADYWQTDGSYQGTYTMETLAAEDERYTAMDAFRGNRVIFCNLSQTPYRELAGVQPHYILADFVKAFHPTLLPHYTPHYYHLLKWEQGGQQENPSTGILP